MKDVLFSISEWKDRQQRKLLHQLFHRFNISARSQLYQHFLLSRRRRDEEVTCYGDLGCFRDEVSLFDFDQLCLLCSLQAKYFRDLSTTLTCYRHPLKRLELSSSCTHNKTENYTRFRATAKHCSSWIDSPGSGVQQCHHRQQQLLQCLLPDQSDHPWLWVFLRQSLGSRDATLVSGCGESGLGKTSSVNPQKQEDCNVICVDWAAGAVDPNYVRAAVNTRLVGKQVI